MSAPGDVDIAQDWKDRQVSIRTDEKHRRWYAFQEPETGELPSVTSVIQDIAGKPFPDSAVRQAELAGARGTEVHRAVALLSGGRRGYTLDWESLDPQVEPRVRLFDEWRKLRRWRPIHIERAFRSVVYGFAGTPDQVGYFEDEEHLGRLTVLDFKPVDAPMAALQLAGYALLIKECLAYQGVVKRVVLHLVPGTSAKDAEGPPCGDNVRDREAMLHFVGAFNYCLDKRMWK